jgi:toxin-antitoxin system PIN domain toxin
VLLDVNLLLYIANPKAPEHERLVPWFEELMNSHQRVALPWHSLFGFIRISTLGQGPAAMDHAMSFVQEWLEWDAVWVPEPTIEHMNIVEKLLRKSPRHHLVPDAHLAALSIEHGLTLCSNDNDFKLFDGVRLLNPLE